MQNTVTLQNDLNQYCEVAGSYQPCRKCEAEESLEKKELLVGVVTVSSWKPAATEEQPELKKKKKCQCLSGATLTNKQRALHCMCSPLRAKASFPG